MLCRSRAACDELVQENLREGPYARRLCMPKMKTKSSAKKRFRLTATGKVKRGAAYRSHILTSKSTKRKRKLRKAHLVSRADLPAVKAMLNV
jgi:large subunit ribosomal protein L35